MLDENIREKLADTCAKARVVFWEDTPGEFADDIGGLELPGVAVIDVRGHELATKRRVLRDERGGRFLLYRAGGAPCIEEDFLLDVKMLARPFAATQSASWAESMGLPLEAAQVVSAHAAFFASKERRAALRGQVEHAYARYVDRLAASWQGLVAERGAWPTDWEGASQRRFFGDYVRPALVMGRVAVVISDALRYEAGADWAKHVADQRKGQVACSAMLASLPTYTQLGMASLLPNDELSIDPKTLCALVDGTDATGAQHREQILQAEVPGAVALGYEDIFSQQAAEALSAAPLAYVYHNVIDMTGDKRDSEERTFAAVDEAFSQLDRACARLFRLGFACVLVTADHGFLYQQDPESFGFAEVPFLDVAVGTSSAKQSRRFVVGRELPTCDSLVEMGAGQLGLSGQLEAGFPKGTRRLRLSGSGARFVHGGMTLQEAVVPCVRITRGKARGSANPVGVDLLTGGTKVITGSFVRFEVFQTEPVGEGVLPVSLRAGLYDAQGQLRSESKPIEVASASANAEERRIPVTLTIAQDVANGTRLTLRVDQRYGTTSKYKTVAQASYVIRRNFGMDF